ncbi:MAG: citrate lyase subunit alpha [Planctomycetota bacterium]
MTEMIQNSLGRLVPTSVNGFCYEPYQGAYADLPPGPVSVVPTVTRQGTGGSKVRKSLVEVIQECVPDGGWVSFPHYYRDDPTALAIVIDALRAAGKRDVKLLGIAFFKSHAQVLLPAVEEGVLAGFEGNVYDEVAKAVVDGKLGAWTVLGRTHGGRARAFQRGERPVDLAIGPVPIADKWGNANGVMGNPASLCGPIGLFEPDARWAKKTCLLAEVIHPGYLIPNPINLTMVDYVVQVPKVGDNRGIATGSTDIRRVSGDPQRNRIADNVVAIMEASGVVKDGFNFQIGSGAGLLALRKMLNIMRSRGIKGGFTVGGSMEYHVDLLDEGLVELFLDGQCFQPSVRLFESLRTNPRHVEVSTSLYYSVAAKQAAVSLMDVVVLGGSEVDVDFNINTVTGYDGVLRTGIGGGPDAAAGGKLTIFVMPVARVNRKGLSAPCVREKVETVVTPGEVVSCVVTDEHVAINPNNKSPYLPALRENAKRFGLNVISIEELKELADAKARELGTLMPVPRYTDDVIFAVEWRDGRLIDCVRRLEQQPV